MKKQKPRPKIPGNESMGQDPATDPRFVEYQHSSLYRIPSKKQTHVAVDSRFAHMLHDDSFSSTAKVDRYGRRLPASNRNVKKGSQKGPKELQRLYRVENEEQNEILSEDAYEADDDERVRIELGRLNGELENNPYDPARDGGFGQSSSSEDDSDETDTEYEADEGDVEIVLLEQEPDQADAPAGEVSRRLAAVNMDWDNIRAVDLMVVFSSFAGGQAGLGGIEKVTIYPSQFGKDRMNREDQEGPPKELFTKKRKGHDSAIEPEDAEEEEDEEEERIRRSMIKEDRGEEYSNPQLRRYQLERMRYYYAVVTCSTIDFAKEIYGQVDGLEYQSSANFFDLQFIPDDMTFGDDEPRDECNEVPTSYRPNDFVTDALQHSKVKLTWDADDSKRKDVQKRAFTGSRNETSENDFRAYLASGSSDEGEDGDGEVEVVDATAAMTVAEDDNSMERRLPRLSKRETERQDLRSRLGLSNKPVPQKSTGGAAPAGSLQVTFTSALSDPKANGDGSIFETKTTSKETEKEHRARETGPTRAVTKSDPWALRDKAKLQRLKDEYEAKASAASREEVEAGDAFDWGTFQGLWDEYLTNLKKAKREEEEEEEAMRERTDTAEEVAYVEGILQDEDMTEATTRDKYILKERGSKAKRRAKAKAKRWGDSEQADSRDEGTGDGEPKEDLGFDDPFFTEGLDGPKGGYKTENRHKHDTRQKRLEHEASRAEKAENKHRYDTRQKSLKHGASEAQKAAEAKELKELMGSTALGDDAGNDKHFSLATLHKAEKALTKSGKKKAKLSASQRAALEAKEQDKFQMDVNDPRFTAVFEKSEYAIDPTHPGFKRTEGMDKWLEEGRKRRRPVIELGEKLSEGETIIVENKKEKRKKSRWINEFGEEESIEDMRIVEYVPGKGRKRRYGIR